MHVCLFVIWLILSKDRIMTESVESIVNGLNKEQYQVVTEKLGGGGHMNIAGAQLEGVTMEEAIDKLKEVLDSMIDEKEI